MLKRILVVLFAPFVFVKLIVQTTYVLGKIIIQGNFP